jgi:hypothetical protein
MEEKRLKQQSDLQSFLLMLLKEHMDRQLSVLPVASTTADNSTQVETIHKEHVSCAYSYVCTKHMGVF